MDFVHLPFVIVTVLYSIWQSISLLNKFLLLIVIDILEMTPSTVVLVKTNKIQNMKHFHR
jgi:hypothetical protein